MPIEVKRGEVWLGHLGQTEGKEQGGKRPLLVVSESAYNAGPHDLLVVLPITTRLWDIPWHLSVQPPEGGLDRDSFIMCDQVRAATKERFYKRFGAVHSETMERVENHLRILLDL